MTRDSTLSPLLGCILSLGWISLAQAQLSEQAVDFEATQAIPDETAGSPSASGFQDQKAADDVTASIRPNAAAHMNHALMPVDLVGRWTVQSVRTKDNRLKKAHKLLLNPAVLTLRSGGQMTMTAGCAHNSGTVNWSEGHFSLGMVLTEDKRCNKAQKDLEEQIMQVLNQASSFTHKEGNLISFQDQAGKELITLSRSD